jgi:Cft2 family RNA processing exonuclease
MAETTAAWRSARVEAVTRAAKLPGWLVVPAFAIGRVQELLYLLRELEAAAALVETITRALGWPARVARDAERIEV